MAGLENKRWFEIEEVSQDEPYSIDADSGLNEQPLEYILSYYNSPKSKEKSGWIFLSDVTNVTEDAACHYIILAHPSRTFRLRAIDRNEHEKWFDTFCQLCNQNQKDFDRNLEHEEEVGPI